jgi:hypothetical protein
VIGLYLRDHLGTDKVRISENPSTLVIVFCIDDERGRLQHRLEVRQEVIADHDAEELENILDAQRVIERMREAGTESVVISTDGGSGDTDGITGLGNLIVGYNEQDTPPKSRYGSHNLVVGTKHGYTSHAGLVAGYDNKITGPFASVSGGMENEASGDYSSVSGGCNNEASGTYSSISGGSSNLAAEFQESIVGDADILEGRETAR